jgi:tetrahydromethanopterin S-methyltransferase subunit A
MKPMYLTFLRVQMKSYKRLLSEKNEKTIVEGLNVSKLKRLELVDAEDFSKFKLAIKKMEEDKPNTISEKTMIVKVFNELINVVVGDTTIFQKILKFKKDLK